MSDKAQGAEGAETKTAGQIACEAWRKEKPRHFLNDQARQKWERIADEIGAALAAQGNDTASVPLEPTDGMQQDGLAALEAAIRTHGKPSLPGFAAAHVYRAMLAAWPATPALATPRTDSDEVTAFKPGDLVRNARYDDRDAYPAFGESAYVQAVDGDYLDFGHGRKLLCSLFDHVAPATPPGVPDSVRALLDAVRPFYACVFNDNGDVSISTGNLTVHHWLALDRAFHAANATHPAGQSILRTNAATDKIAEISQQRLRNIRNRWEADGDIDDGEVSFLLRLAEMVAGASDGSRYQYREIGEGDGWRDCTRETYLAFARDPHIDTREIKGHPAGQSAGSGAEDAEQRITNLANALKSARCQRGEQERRAITAEQRVIELERGKIHPALAVDVQEHRNQAYQTGWDDGYAEGHGKATAREG